ncbi:hypothetical protein LRS10_13560 [Phenylobacterium sp. J426]|uniref:exonuclease domain-containing protein n=1 Tax=Phenylobacterium sp. J426 TaxID=2898439 RepID=UPI0021506F35|nr:exonuclease domain-containing protein [Phenylobacterium sp. J426]MCR5875120.1 hypothetical protein [Phenylobacterium sp. J426]
MPRIRVIDYETTGMEPPAVVIEHGYCDVENDGDGWRIGPRGSFLYRAEAVPPEVRAVHHICAADLHDKPSFDPAGMWSDCLVDGINVVAAHNLDFEARFSGEQKLPVLCTLKAALRVWPEAPAHNNGTLRYWLEDQGLIAPEPDACMPPHRAGPDAYVTAHILLALLTKATAAEMVAWTKEPRVLPTCPIGEWRGKRWADVDAGFLRWMINKPVEADLVWNARRELDRRRAA